MKKYQTVLTQVSFETVRLFSYGTVFCKYLLYTGKYVPLGFFSPLSPSLSVDECKTGRPKNVSNYLSLITTMSGRMQDGAKHFASEEWQKPQGAKILLYTVLQISPTCYHRNYDPTNQENSVYPLNIDPYEYKSFHSIWRYL